MRAGAGVALLVAALCSGVCPAAADTYYLSKVETPDLRLLYYSPLQDYLTPYVGRAFENSFQFQQKMFDWTPWDKTTVLLEDQSDNGSAAMRSTPYNGLTIDIAPSTTVFETYTPGERFFTLMNHELVHVATIDAWNDEDAGWRHFFMGKPLARTAHPESILYTYLAQPRGEVPRWYLEGSAVFVETWMGGGIGRAQGGYDEMVFRAMVRDNARFFDPVGLASEGNDIDFQVGANDYLYGTRFDSYLALVYGPEKLIQWVKRGKDSKAYYATQFEHVFGKPLDDAWNDWIAFEHEWQKKNLERVRQYPLTAASRLTSQAVGSVSRTFYDAETDSLITGIRDVGQIASIGAISLKDGSVRKLAYLKGAGLYRVTALAFDPDHRKVFFTADNNAMRDLVELDLATGKTRTLLSHARIGDLAYNRADGSIWGVRHVDGVDSLVRIRAAHDDWNLVRTLPYGQDLFDLDISPDGKFLCATISEINGQSRLDVYRISDLLAGKADAVVTLSLGTSIPEGGVFSPDGRYVYASSYYTGVANIYRLNVQTNSYDAVSNAETGFFRPLPMPDGSLVVYEYTGQGFLPERFTPKALTDLSSVRFLGAEIADKQPVVKTWAVGSPAKVPFEGMVTDKGFYKPRDELRLESAYPIIEGYKGHVAGGWNVQFSDPEQYNQLSINAAWSPAGDLRTAEQFHGDINYSTLQWHVGYWHNNADFYDLFGPTERSRKGDAVTGGYHDVIIYDPPVRLDFTADVGLYSGLDTLPGAQNVRTDNDQSIATGKLGLVYSNIDRSLGAIDNEDGYRANIQYIGNFSDYTYMQQVEAGFDFGFALPWNHASLWFYNSAGASAGDHNNVLDFFYLGAFGNNYVDDREIKRYREFESFPGFAIDAIGARDFVRSTAEFNFPPIRFDDVGWDAFYLGSLRTAAFGSVMDATPGLDGSNVMENVGLQVDFNFTIAVRLPMTLSFGDAVGFAGGRPERNEIMVSLKIL